MISSVPGRPPRTGAEFPADFVLAGRWLAALTGVHHLAGDGVGPPGGANVDLGPAGVSRARGGVRPPGTPRRLGGQPAGAASWRAMRAMALAHWVICAAGR